DFLSRRVAPYVNSEAIKRFERRMDLCVPMVHDGRLKGVIAVAELGRRPPNEKSMLRMVADLGSIALNTAALLRAAELAANSDALTRLFNKRFLLRHLEEEIAKARRTGEPLSVFFFDIDHFKNYNDVNGHQAGDDALKITGRLVTDMLREDDIPARYGGEEFVIVLPNTTKLGAYEAGEKIRQAVESYAYAHGRSQPNGRVTISGGVASFAEDGGTVEELLEAADAALYAAKRSGRNRVLMYEIGVLHKQLSD
ncbi:MAG: sensor domain-containing diguanylate cyclase, partial [Acidobacteriota bacterium]|nr:sensor domain-containing diguanylate cyclase [Acidobacteriota bacterium]